MALCASCGLQISDLVEMCPHHAYLAGTESWSRENRIMCDFFHRGVIPKRLTEAERAEEVIYAPDGMF